MTVFTPTEIESAARIVAKLPRKADADYLRQHLQSLFRRHDTKFDPHAFEAQIAFIRATLPRPAPTTGSSANANLSNSESAKHSESGGLQ